MYKTVGKEYSFDRREMHDFDESKKHLEIEQYKLKEATKALVKREAEIQHKEQELAERAKLIEPEDKINMLNIKVVVERQKGINFVLKQELEKNSELQRENSSKIHGFMKQEQIIIEQIGVIDIQQEKISELEGKLTEEIERTNELLNISISHESLRNEMIKQTKQKIHLFDIMVKLIKEFLPELIKACPKFVRELLDYKILNKEELPQERQNNRNNDR